MDDVSFPGWQPEKSIQVIEDNGLTRVLVRGRPYMRWRSGDEQCVRLATCNCTSAGWERRKIWRKPLDGLSGRYKDTWRILRARECRA